MSLFNLSWFKSENEKELDKLKLEEQVLKNEYRRADIARLQTSTTEQTTIPPDAHLNVCKSIKLAGPVLTVVLNDGAVISKLDATYADFTTARGLCDEQELILLMTSEEGKKEAKKMDAEIKKVKMTQVNLQILSQLKDFEMKGNSLYLKGTSRTIPEMLINEFIDVIDGYDFDEYGIDAIDADLIHNDAYQALKNFFLWCCLNPRAEVADQLYAFLKKNSFRITKQGFFVALRNVVRLRGDDNHDMVDFVSNAYNKIKAVWKKKPSEYFVRLDTDGNYSLSALNTTGGTNTVVGNLETLYLDLPNMAGNRFTDAHTETFDIRVGQVVSMPPERCNWSTADCAHAGLKYVASL